MSFIDVGQGDSVLVRAGGEGYLIDAGRAEEGPNIVDFLRGRGVRTLDVIVVSNPDADHICGFLDVFDAFEVETVYLSGDPIGTLTFNTFLRAAREKGSDLEVVRAGMLMDWGGVRADVIAPRRTPRAGSSPRPTTIPSASCSPTAPPASCSPATPRPGAKSTWRAGRIRVR